MKRRITGLFIIALIFMFGLMFSDVRAGEINSAEQRLVGVVSDTFVYNGKSYVVKSENIAQGQSKLAEDGVELTDAEADAYIAQFQGSYEELVEEGYCSEVGQSSSDSTASVSEGEGDSNPSEDKEKNNPEVSEKPKGQKESNILFLRSVLGEPAKDTRSDNDSAAEEAPSKEDNSVEEKDSEEEWLEEEEDLGTVIDFSQSDMDAAKNQKVILHSSGENENITVREESETETNQKKSNFIDRLLYMRQWKVISCIVFGFSILTLSGILWYILAIRRHKRKKRKIRRGLVIASGISMAGCAFLLMFALALYFGVYNKDAIHRQLMESNYYSGVAQMTRELTAQVLDEAGYDQTLASEIFSLSNIYIEEKQYIDGILSGEKERLLSVRAIDDALEDKLREDDQNEKEAVIEEINVLYRSTMQFELGKVIRESKNGFLPWFYGVAGLSCLLLILLFWLTYQMYGYLHKALRVSSVGIFLSSMLVTGASLTVKMRRFAEGISAEPVYYQQFLQKYANWSVNVMLYVGCIGLLAAVALTVWKRYLHMIYVD